MTRAPRPGQEMPVEQMSGGALARMRPDLSVGAALPPPGGNVRGGGSPGAWHTRAAWATMPGWLVMTAGPGAADGLGPSGRGQARGDARMGAPCRPRCDPGRRRGRALGRRAPAAGPGRVDALPARAGGLGPGHRSADPGRGRRHAQNMQQNIRGSKGSLLRQPGPKAPAAARTPTPAARRLERHLSRAAPFFKATNTPQYKLASPVVGMVFGVWWGLRHPRRLTVLAIASETYTSCSMSPGWPGPCSGAGRGSPPGGPWSSPDR